MAAVRQRVLDITLIAVTLAVCVVILWPAIARILG